MSGEVDIAAIVGLSLRVAALAMVIAFPLAFAVAWVLARTRLPGRALLQALVTLPLVLPPVVTGYLLLLAFGVQGPVGGWLKAAFGIEIAFRWTGAAVASGVMALPLLVRPIRQALESMDRGLEEAAGTLGASPLRVFATVTVPLTAPGMLSGLLLGFAKALGEFGATITFVSNIPGETQTLSLAIYSLLQTPAGDDAVATLIGVCIVLAIGATLASEWLARRWRTGGN